MGTRWFVHLVAVDPTDAVDRVAAHGAPVEVKWPGSLPLAYPDDADNDSSLAGPLYSFASGIDGAAVSADPS